MGGKTGTQSHVIMRSLPVRGISGTRVAMHGDERIDPDAAAVNVAYIKSDGTRMEVEGRVGQNLLRLAQKHGIEVEGACEGVCACSTCHVIVGDEFFDTVEDLHPPSEVEEDMLDMAWGLTPTSRLGCQIKLTEELEGIEVTLPHATRNFYVDGHVPQPH